MKSARTAWIVAPVLVVGYAILGHFYDTSQHLGWLPAYAQVAAAACPAIFVLIYTTLGLTGGAKWWKNDLGTNFVWLEIANVCTAGMIAWAVVFNHGLLNTPGKAWTYVGGLIAAASIITWRSLIFIRAEHLRRKGNPDSYDRIAELQRDKASMLEEIQRLGGEWPRAEV